MSSTVFSTRASKVLVLIDFGELGLKAVNGFGGAAVRTDAERIVTADLHEIGGFIEDGGDGLVVGGHQKILASGKRTPVQKLKPLKRRAPNPQRAFATLARPSVSSVPQRFKGFQVKSEEKLNAGCRYQAFCIRVTFSA